MKIWHGPATVIKAGLLLSQVFSIFHYWAYCFEAKQDVSFNACVENPAQDICVNPYVRNEGVRLGNFGLVFQR